MMCWLGLTTFFALSINTAQAFAANPDFEIRGYVGAAYDLRQRGLSLSERDIAPVGLLRIEADGNLYSELYAARANDGRGSDALISGTAGWSHDFNGYTLDLSLTLDSFHGSSRSVVYDSYTARLSRDFGLVIIDTSYSLSPGGRWNTPQNASHYISGGVSYPVPDMPDLTLFASAGYDIRDRLTNVFDWSVGASLFVKDFEIVAQVQDSTVTTSFLDTRTGGFDFGATSVTAGLRFYF